MSKHYFYYNKNDKRTFSVLPFGGTYSNELKEDVGPYVELIPDQESGNIAIEFKPVKDKETDEMVAYPIRVSENWNVGSVFIQRFRIKE